MKPIWYFVGWILMAMGAVITAAGAYDYLHPERLKTILAGLHPSLWWGIFMMACGLVLLKTSGKNLVE
jgi:hypothetical protein